MTFDIKFYGQLLWRRLPVMATLVVFCSIVGFMIAERLPATYETSATLLVESAQITDQMVGVSSGPGANQQLEMVQRRLMTRANLLEVARENKAFPNISQMTPDEIVNAMRAQTTISGRGRGKNASSGMTIGFAGSNPQRVAQIVNQYVTIILASNSDFRTNRAQGALDFFEQEVESLNEDLQKQSGEIISFKNRNADALPENLNYRMSRESMLQERLSRTERDLDALKVQRESVLRIYETTGNVQNDTARTPEENELLQLERELNGALAIYSDENPKVRLLRNRIKLLTEQMETLASTEGQGDAEEGTQTRANTALEISLAEIESRSNTLVREKTAVQAELEGLRSSIERTPLNRITIETMERAQENTQSLYSSAVQRLNQARMGERVELSSKGERITLLEPANVPDEPSSPNRLLIVSGSTALGMALAAGLFLLMELFNQSIRRPSEIEKALNIKPLVTLPLIETAASRRWRRIKKICIFSATVVAIPIVLWVIDTFYIRLDRLFERIVDIVI